MRRKMRRFWWTQQNRLLSVLKKQKQHTPKTQLLISLQAGEIIALAFSNGKKHDFQLFKDSGIHVKAETVLDFIGLERGRILATRDWPYCST